MHCEIQRHLRVLVAGACLLLAGCATLTSVLSTTQETENSNPPKQRPILLIAVDEDPALLAAARQLGAQRCPIVYEAAFIVGRELDEAKLRRTVASTVPAGWSGFACLDIENEWYAALGRDPSSPEFREGAKQLLRALMIAKEVRPEARWSYYGIPELPFFVKNEEGSLVGWDKGSAASKAEEIASARRAQIIIDGCDWVAPTLYDFYPDSAAPEWVEAQKAKVREIVKLSREMAAASRRPKPVLPFVWHRIHSSNKRYGLQLLDNREFIEGQVRPALEAGAAGVIWWGADRYMIGSGELGRSQPAEVGSLARNPAAVSAHLLKINQEKLDALAPLFR